MLLPRIKAIVLIALFITTNRASAQVYQWVDENGQTVFSNLTPPTGVKIAQPEQKNAPHPETTDPAVSSYYKFSKLLKDHALRLKNGLLPDEKTINIQQDALDELTTLIKPKFPDKIVPLATASKIDSLKKMSESLEEKAQSFRERGNHTKSLSISDRAQACRFLLIKSMSEDALGINNIPYQQIYISDDICFDEDEKESEINEIPTKKPNATYSIKSSCQNEWKDDYRMVEHCINKQSQALNNISRMRGPILEKCKEEWGSDYRMVEHCTNKQSEAKDRLDRM